MIRRGTFVVGFLLSGIFFLNLANISAWFGQGRGRADTVVAGYPYPATTERMNLFSDYLNKETSQSQTSIS